MSEQEPTMLWKSTRVSNNCVMLSIYIDDNPTEQAKFEVRKQIACFLEKQAIEGNTLFTIAVTQAEDAPKQGFRKLGVHKKRLNGNKAITEGKTEC